MPIRLAILGLDPIQRPWLQAIDTLRASAEIELVGVGHRTVALARDAADRFAKPWPPAFDDLRLLLKDTQPQVLLMDRPANAGLDFLLACVSQKIGIVSLGPPVENLAEAHALSEVLEPRTHLLYVWPRMADAFAYRHCAQADEFVKPIRFAAARWLGANHALARSSSADDAQHAVDSDAPWSVRSLSVLAWDAIATLIDLLGVPTTIYASVRGSVGSNDTFTDISGACALTMRFPDDGVASMTLSDKVPGPWQREILLLGQGGTVRLETDAYEFRDEQGKLIDSGRAADAGALAAGENAPGGSALETLREFLRHFSQAPSPARGWPHRLVDIAAAMEALVVSHRTGQAESPERFRVLRR